MPVTKQQYVTYLKEKLENEAVMKKYQPNSEIVLDWGELELILSSISDCQDKSREPTVPTKSSRIEQQYLYSSFIKAQGLEETFEYYSLTQQNTMNIGRI